MKNTPTQPDRTDRLIQWARQTPKDTLSEQPPCGFATRVLAICVRKAPQTPWWEYLALRGALAGGAVAAACWRLLPLASSVTEEAALAASIIQTALPSEMP